MPAIPIYRGSTGLNTKLDPARLPAGQDTGLRPMCRAVNVLVDDGMRVARCDGYSLIASGSHVVWGDGQALGMAIRDDWLHLLSVTGSLTALQAVTPGVNRISAVRWLDRLYWTTGVEQGFIHEGQAFPWVLTDYTGPDTNKNFTGPPIGHILEGFAGRMLVASGANLYYSELWEPGLFRLAANYIPFASDITMVAAVGDGLWASDGRTIYWLAGFDPNGWIPIAKTEYPAILGQAINISAEATPYDNLIGSGQAVKVGTPRGLLTLGAGGYIVNDTLKNIEWDHDPWLLTALRGAAGKYREHIYFTYEP